MSVSASSFGALGLKFLTDTFADFAKSIVISSLTKSPDYQGGYSEVWSTFATVDAFILKQGSSNVGGSEQFKYGRVISENAYKFHISSLAGLDNTMKITFDSEDYQIRSINNIAASDQWMIIEAEKGVAQ